MTLRIEHSDGEDRPPWRSLIRGALCRCPACGRGKLFRRFLKPIPACEACGAEMHHHRADDMPPYIVMFLVGHVVIWGLMVAELDLNWPIWAHAMVWPALTLALCLGLVQPVKGAIIGLQWALRMHGFGDARDEEAVLRPRALQDAE